MHYIQRIKKEVDLLRNANPARLSQLSTQLQRKRLDWFTRQNIRLESGNILDQAYQLFLNKLGIEADQAPIVGRSEDKLVVHSKNFCPTLEACKILGLDTRDICRQLTEAPTQVLLQQLDPRLRFTRNYEQLRPHTPYCEEMILLDQTA